MRNPDISFNIFIPPFGDFNMGNNPLVEVNHSNLQLRRNNYDLIKSFPNLILRNSVEGISKVHKVTKYISVTIATFLGSDPE